MLGSDSEGSADIIHSSIPATSTAATPGTLSTVTTMGDEEEVGRFACVKVTYEWDLVPLWGGQHAMTLLLFFKYSVPFLKRVQMIGLLGSL